jgi:hypothetical protein
VTSSRLRAVVLAIAGSLLVGCATAPSEGSPCPPVVAYSRDFLARAAGEIDSLPAGSAIEQMLADYQVMRDKVAVLKRTRQDKGLASCHATRVTQWVTNRVDGQGRQEAMETAGGPGRLALLAVCAWDLARVGRAF